MNREHIAFTDRDRRALQLEICCADDETNSIFLQTKRELQNLTSPLR